MGRGAENLLTVKRDRYLATAATKCRSVQCVRSMLMLLRWAGLADDGTGREACGSVSVPQPNGVFKHACGLKDRQYRTIPSLNTR